MENSRLRQRQAPSEVPPEVGSTAEADVVLGLRGASEVRKFGLEEGTLATVVEHMRSSNRLGRTYSQGDFDLLEKVLPVVQERLEAAGIATRIPCEQFGLGNFGGSGGRVTHFGAVGIECWARQGRDEGVVTLFLSTKETMEASGRSTGRIFGGIGDGAIMHRQNDGVAIGWAGVRIGQKLELTRMRDDVGLLDGLARTLAIRVDSAVAAQKAGRLRAALNRCVARVFDASRGPRNAALLGWKREEVDCSITFRPEESPFAPNRDAGHTIRLGGRAVVVARGADARFAGSGEAVGEPHVMARAVGCPRWVDGMVGVAPFNVLNQVRIEAQVRSDGQPVTPEVLMARVKHQLRETFDGLKESFLNRPGNYPVLVDLVDLYRAARVPLLDAEFKKLYGADASLEMEGNIIRGTFMADGEKRVVEAQFFLEKPVVHGGRAMPRRGGGGGWHGAFNLGGDRFSERREVRILPLGMPHLHLDEKETAFLKAFGEVGSRMATIQREQQEADAARSTRETLVERVRDAFSDRLEVAFGRHATFAPPEGGMPGTTVYTTVRVGSGPGMVVAEVEAEVSPSGELSEFRAGTVKVWRPAVQGDELVAYVQGLAQPQA